VEIGPPYALAQVDALASGGGDALDDERRSTCLFVAVGLRGDGVDEPVRYEVEDVPDGPDGADDARIT
jgi:hypothetical protein